MVPESGGVGAQVDYYQDLGEDKAICGFAIKKRIISDVDRPLVTRSVKENIT